MNLGNNLFQARKKAGLSQEVDLKEIEEVIKNTNEEKEEKINWTNAWSKKYPVLATYPQKVNVSKYAVEIRNMLDSLAYDYGYSELDSMLVLKDILYHEWKDNFIQMYRVIFLFMV